jgi:hypothetical protein
VARNERRALPKILVVTENGSDIVQLPSLHSACLYRAIAVSSGVQFVGTHLSAKRDDQGGGGFQIRGLEALVEPVVNCREELMRIRGFTSSVPMLASTLILPICQRTGIAGCERRHPA